MWGRVLPSTQRGISLGVHGDDFTFAGIEEDLIWIRDLMESWFDIKVRGIMGNDPGDVKEIVIFRENCSLGKIRHRVRGGPEA